VPSSHPSSALRHLVRLALLAPTYLVDRSTGYVAHRALVRVVRPAARFLERVVQLLVGHG